MQENLKRGIFHVMQAVSELKKCQDDYNKIWLGSENKKIKIPRDKVRLVRISKEHYEFLKLMSDLESTTTTSFLAKIIDDFMKKEEA